MKAENISPSPVRKRRTLSSKFEPRTRREKTRHEAPTDSTYGDALTLCLAAGAALIPSPAAAQVCAPLDDGRLADAFYEGTVIYWDPVVKFRALTLTISGPCEDIVKTFGPKDEIMFDIREIERITDGQYNWTLRREASID